MNKLAVFVEGLTEQIFAEKLLIEIAGKKNIQIEKCELRGGNAFERKRLCFRRIGNGEKYFAYIIDCRGDSTVKSDIIENYDSLVKNGYKSIIGIRDVYPNRHADIPKLRKYLQYYVKTIPIAPKFILSIMEIEAWFLAEHTHFQRIHQGLTIDRIRASLNFDPSQECMELRNHPAEDLHNIYALEGFEYGKRKCQTKRTVEALDFGEIYFGLSTKIQSIQDLISEIERFMEQ